MSTALKQPIRYSALLFLCVHHCSARRLCRSSTLFLPRRLKPIRMLPALHLPPSASESATSSEAHCLNFSMKPAPFHFLPRAEHIKRLSPLHRSSDFSVKHSSPSASLHTRQLSLQSLHPIFSTKQESVLTSELSAKIPPRQTPQVLMLQNTNISQPLSAV